MWQKATDKSPFDSKDLERLQSLAKDPIATMVINKNYLLNIYEQFDFNQKLLIGGDFGGSTTKDATCFSIVDPMSLKVLADFNNNKADPIEVADIIYELMYKFFPNAIFIPEQNSYSDACIAILNRTNVADRIYFEYKTQKHEMKTKDGFKKVENVKTKVFGINTNTATRDLMIGLLFDIVANTPEEINSPLIIDDISGLERNKQGKIEAIAPNHDDNLFSYLMVRYVMAYGNNLARFKIYKKIDSTAENNAYKGARSDEEYLRNFSSIIQANFNEMRRENQSDIQSEIIERHKQQIARLKEEKDFQKFEDGFNDGHKNSFEKIFSYNNMSGQIRRNNTLSNNRLF